MRKSVAPRESVAPATACRTRQGGPLHFLDVGNIKEQRNFKDKAVFNNAAHQLLNYLEENGFPASVNIKQLEQPTTALVTQIFKFLMTKISPGYDMGTGRIEEEFPKTMLDLHYPFGLKKSHVQSATTPSGWPVVFGALHWLYETLVDDVSEILKQRESKPWRDYYGKLYEAFLYQKPVAPEAVESMRRVLLDEAKVKKNKAVQNASKVDSLQAQLADLEAQDNELTTLQLKINEDNAEIQQLKQEIEAKKVTLSAMEQKEDQSSKRLANIELECSEAFQTLEKLKDAIQQQSIDKNVIMTTRSAIQQLILEIGDAEHNIENHVFLAQDTQQAVSLAKAPVDEMLVRFRSGINQLLNQLSRLSIGIDPGALGMSLPSNPMEQLQCFKNVIKPASVELSDTLNEENVAAKHKLREFSGLRSKLSCEQERLDRELEFLELQNKRLIEEERQFVEREEKKRYEWRSQAEEQAAKRRAHISELDARNSDIRHRIATIDKEIESENMVLVDRARTYEQVLTNITSTAADAYKPVTENMLRVLKAIREHQKREEETLRRGFEMVNQHPLLKQCLAEVMAEREQKMKAQ